MSIRQQCFFMFLFPAGWEYVATAQTVWMVASTYAPQNRLRRLSLDIEVWPVSMALGAASIHMISHVSF